MIMREGYDKDFGVGGPKWEIPESVTKNGDQPPDKPREDLFNHDLRTVIKMKKEGKKITNADTEELEQRINEQFNEISTQYRYLKKGRGVQADGWEKMARINPSFATQYHDWQEQKLKLSFLEGRLTNREQATLAEILKGKSTVTNVAGETDSKTGIDKTLSYGPETLTDTATRGIEQENSKKDVQENIWSDLEEISEKLRELRHESAAHKKRKPIIFGLGKWREENEILTREIERLERKVKGLQSITMGDLEKTTEKQKRGEVIPFPQKEKPRVESVEPKSHFGKAAAVAAGVLVGLSPAGEKASSTIIPQEEAAAHELKVATGQPATEMNAEEFLTAGVSGPLDKTTTREETVRPKKGKIHKPIDETAGAERKISIEFSSQEPIPIATFPLTERKILDKGPIQVETPGLTAEEDTERQKKARWWGQLLGKK